MVAKEWKIEIRCPVCKTPMETIYICPDKVRILKCDHMVIERDGKWVLIVEKDKPTKRRLPRL
jgi:uncharacterized protein (DUF2225 family)